MFQANTVPLPLRALVVDTLSFNRKLTANVLQKTGYQVDTLSLGSAAMLALSRQYYSVVVVTAMLEEGFSGAETVRKFRDIYPTGRLVIILDEHIFGFESQVANYDVEVIARWGFREYFSVLDTDKIALSDRIDVTVKAAIDGRALEVATRLGLHVDQGVPDFGMLANILASMVKRGYIYEEIRFGVFKRLRQSIVAGLVAALLMYFQWTTGKIFIDLQTLFKWFDR